MLFLLLFPLHNSRYHFPCPNKPDDPGTITAPIIVQKADSVMAVDLLSSLQTL